MHNCPASPFGCSCSTECRIEKNRKESEATVRTIIAKQTAFPVLSIFTVAMLLAIGTASALTLDNHFKREALRNQENVAWR